MDTERLKYFCLIAETGTLTRAADLLGLSHSALSKAMKLLSEEVGFEIFHPVGRGLEVSTRGQALYGQAREILARIEGLKGVGQSESLPKSLSIGLSEVFSLSLVSLLADAISEPLSFLELEPGALEDEIEKNQIDFGLTFVPAPNRDVEYLRLCRVILGVFARPQLIEMIGAQSLPFVIPQAAHSPNPLSFKNRDGWPLDLERRTQYRATTLAQARELVMGGQAAIFIPDCLAERWNTQFAPESRIRRVEWPGLKKASTSREVFLVKRRHEPESREMKKAARLVRQVFGKSHS